MTVNSELDELLSDSTPVVETEVQTQAPTDTNVARDESGRFASKTPAASTDGNAPLQQEAPEAGHDEALSQGGVPMPRLKAEADKRREAEASNEALRREIAELRGMVQARQQPAQQQPQQEQQPASLWDDPNAFLNSQLSPLQNRLEEMREELWESRAASVHTPEAVQAAKAAAEKLFGTPEGKVLHQQITAQGGNPFDNLVKWHKQQSAIARVGDDPDTWLQTELEKLLSDPAEQAKILERIRAGAPTQNNGKPVTNFAPSLSRMPSGGNTAQDNDMSDAGLFNFATSR